jgi:hypothetical protein
MGHKQSFTPILPECLLLGVKRTSNEWMAGTEKQAQGRVFGLLVAGVRLSNYMQIEIALFPVVA